jgi:hypothetical protein
MSNREAALKWVVGTIIALIAAGGGATAWLDWAKKNHYWPFTAEPYVIIEHITATQENDSNFDPPFQVEVSVNGENYYYPTKDGSHVPASQIKKVRIRVATARKYYVTIKLSGRAQFTSSDGFFFPSDYPFSQIVTAHLVRMRKNPNDPIATAEVALTVENK